jgi:hypothetical protein
MNKILKKQDKRNENKNSLFNMFNCLFFFDVMSFLSYVSTKYISLNVQNK